MIKRVPFGLRGVFIGIGALSALVVGCSLALDFDESKITEGQPSADSAITIDTALPDTGSPIDTTAPDTFTAPEVAAEVGDDVADTFVPDTFVLDTLVPDTFVPDTFVPDTFVPDTFVPDTGAIDTGIDTGTLDTGTLDTGTADTGVVDTGLVDTGVDTSVVDTGLIDTGVADTGVADTGVDLGVDSGFTPSNYAGCTSSDYTTNDRTAAGASRTITFPTSAYSPPCMRVKVGQVVTWSGSFGSHPLRPATTNNPAGGLIPSVGPTPDPGTASATFTAAGHYGYYCEFHGTSSGSGMAGTIEVVP